MKSVKYIGLDVHQATISIAVLDANGKLVMQSVIATQASTILDFIQGVRGELHVALEEGISAHWLYGVLKPHVHSMMVCDSRKSALMNAGNKSDRIEARKLAELLRAGQLSPVFHEDVGVRTLRELARSYLTLTQDVTRVMNRIKGVYRSQAIACAGKRVYTHATPAGMARACAKRAPPIRYVPCVRGERVQGDFHTTTVADHSFMFYPLVFSARAFPIPRRTKNALAEKSALLRFEGAVIDRLRVFDFALAPRPHRVARRNADRDLIKTHGALFAH